MHEQCSLLNIANKMASIIYKNHKNMNRPK